MYIQIDYQDKRPIYEQVVEKIQNLIARGILKADERIPSVRDMAIELSINPNTIQKAYQELERMGYIYTIKGRGKYVSPAESWHSDRKDEYMEDLKEALTELKAIGATREEIIQYINDIY